MATIKEIQTLLAGVKELDSPLFDQLKADQRKGVQLAIQKRQKELRDLKEEYDRQEALLVYEKDLYAQGIEWIAGVDEVGRGPLAGPVVAAAVILPKRLHIPFLNDSKKIPKSRHENLYDQIMAQAVAVGIGQVDASMIDTCNIYQASKLAMEQAIGNLAVSPQHLLVDAMTLNSPISQTAIIKGDATSLSIAAASIVAKVTRDRLMTTYDKEYPGYGFGKHAGYGTKEHLLALEQLGPCPIHRKTFEPIKSMCAD